jgi:hypothetical protein
MAKVKYKPFCMQGSFFEELPSPFFNGVEGLRGMDLKATGMAKEALAKAF